LKFRTLNAAICSRRTEAKFQALAAMRRRFLYCSSNLNFYLAKILKPRGHWLFKFRASRPFAALFKFTSAPNDRDLRFARRRGRRLLNLTLRRPQRLKFYPHR